MLSDDDRYSLSIPLANELAGSAVNEHPLRLSHYHYEAVCMSVEEIAKPTFRLRDIQICQVKTLGVPIRPPASDYHNGMIIATWSVKRNPMDSCAEDAAAKQKASK